MDYLDDDIFRPALDKCHAVVDPDLLARIREMTDGNGHSEAFRTIVSLTENADLIAEVETCLIQGLPRLALLRKVCLCLPYGKHLYSAC